MRMRGLTKDERETLEREWGGIPVVDAPENLRLFVSKEDIESATRKDASCCALANCCKRSLGSQGVFFYKTRAYVHVPTSNQMQRFFLTRSGMDFVANFDKGEAVKAQEIVLRKPTESEKLDAEHKRQQWIKRKKEGMTGNAKHDNAIRGTKPQDPRKVKPVANNVVRSGIGKVSFSVGAATGKAGK